MNSMTGYGRAEGVCEALSLSVEASSVNKKTLEIYVALPRDFQMLERGALEAVRTRFQRGKINVHISLKSPTAVHGKQWDSDRVQMALDELRIIAKKTNVPFEPSTDLLLRLVQMVGQEVAFPDVALIEAALGPLLASALDEMANMRKAEGTALSEDIQMRLNLLESSAQTVRKALAQTVPAYRDSLLERLKQAKLELDISDERVLKELAFFADKTDVTEELTRFQSHLKQFRDFLKSSEAVGRKMDFLCQELNREVNTIGSKANNLEITRNVLDMKNEVERIREQIQNIE